MRTIKNFINLFFLMLGYVFPRSKHKIVFGAWEGKSYSDNPKFLFEYFFNHPEWRIVWIGNKAEMRALPSLPRHASFAVRHSIMGMWHSLTAGTWVFSHSTNDISLVAIWGRTLLIDTCHGVALKKVGATCHSFKFKENKAFLNKFWDIIFAKKIYIAMPSSQQATDTFRGFPGMFQCPALPFGSTTLDFILANKNNKGLIQSLRQKFSKLFSLPADKKWIVYAPTFRWTTENNFSFKSLSENEQRLLSNSLEPQNAIVIEKLHPSVRANTTEVNNSLIFTMSGKNSDLVEPQELWLAADAVISDYSSCVVPFFLQQKPVIHFVYDYDYYTTKDTGLIANLKDIRFGLIAEDFKSLCYILTNLDSAENQCGSLAPTLIEYEDGHSCEKYLEFIRQHLKSI